MSIRERMNSNTTLATIAAVVLLSVALGVAALQLRDPGMSYDDVYYWDLETGEAFIASNETGLVADAPSGDKGVRARLFACNACSPDTWFGYLERMSDEYLQAKEDGTLAKMHAMNRQPFEQQHHLIRPLDGEQWVPEQSREGQQVIQAVRSQCEGQWVRCEP